MTETVNAVEKDYQVGDQAEKWAEGVLSQIRRQTVSIKCRAGFNTLRVYNVDAIGFSQKIAIYTIGKAGRKLSWNGRNISSADRRKNKI